MAEYEKMEFTSHSKHIKKYIHMWNNSHGKLTGNWQENVYTNKAARRISTQSAGMGKKKKEGIRSGPVPLEGICNEIKHLCG